MTKTLDFNASRIAATWVSASTKPICFSAHGKALFGSIVGQCGVSSAHQPVQNGALRPIETSQKDTGRFTHLVSYYCALLQLELERRPDQLVRHFKQLFSQRNQFFRRQACESACKKDPPYCLT
jgi:hypothetical protein